MTIYINIIRMEIGIYKQNGISLEGAHGCNKFGKPFFKLKKSTFHLVEGLCNQGAWGRIGEQCNFGI